MTPKEKANNLCMRFLIQTSTDIPYGVNKTIAKECALIAVDEIIEATSIKYEFRDAELFYAGKKPMQYWLDVKKEIEKL